MPLPSALIALVAALAPLTVSVRDQPYGARGDGMADDAPALQAAVDAVFASGGGTVLLPSGTYLLRSVQGPSAVLLRPRSGVSLRGHGPTSVLKVAPGLNGVGRTFNVISHEPEDQRSPSIDDVTFSDFLIDMSGTENLVPREEPAKLNRGISIRRGVNIAVERVTVINNPGQQCFAFGANVSPHSVRNLRFVNNRVRNVGANVEGNVHQIDHSVLYAQADGATISGNVFENDHGGGRSTTAIESHSSSALISGNIARNFSRMFFIVASKTDQVGAVYSGNVGTGLEAALAIWAYPGHVMKSITITGNSFEVVKNREVAIDASTNVQPGALPSGLAVHDNSLRFADDNLAGFGDAISVGRVADITIRGNRIENTLGSAVALGAIEPGVTSVVVENNVLVDCGRSSAQGGAYHAGIRLHGTRSLRLLRVSGNVIRNSSPGAPMWWGIVGNVPIQSAQLSQNFIDGIDHEIAMLGSYGRMLVEHVGTQDPNGTTRADAGSRWVNPVSGSTYRKTTPASSATGWVQEVWAPAPPALGSWGSGDRVWNSDPKPGTAVGWICVKGGKGGSAVWRAIPPLAQ